MVPQIRQTFYEIRLILECVRFTHFNSNNDDNVERYHNESNGLAAIWYMFYRMIRVPTMV